MQSLNPLLCPLGELSPDQMAPAIALARQLGESVSERILPLAAASLLEGGQAGVDPLSYVACAAELPAPAPDLALVAGWKAAFEGGEAMDDPRVQAFVSAFHEHMAEMGAEVRRRREVVAQNLEVPLEELVPEASRFRGHLLYARRQGEVVQRTLVLREEEANELAREVLFQHLHEVDTENLIGPSVLPESHAWILDRLKEDLGAAANPILSALLEDSDSFLQRVLEINGRSALLLGPGGEFATESRFQGYVFYQWADARTVEVEEEAGGGGPSAW